MLNHALRYAKFGLSVIPLEPKGKRPLIDWKDYQTRRATETEIQAWWTKWPEANIGVVTGQISGVCVVDLDGPEGIKSAELLGLHSPYYSMTGREDGGKHLWFKNAPIMRNSASQLAKGLDIRAEGGYVVAPPSVHPNGRRYRWLKSLNLGLLKEFPVALLVPTVPTQSVKVNKEEFWSKRPEGWIAQALQEMKHGNIDDTLFTVCSRLRADGYTSEDARILLEPHASRVGATPGHLDDKIDNVWSRYEPNEKKTSITGVGSLRSGIETRLIIHTPTNPDSWKQFNAREHEVTQGVSLKTGYTKLDQMLLGGLESSRLFTVAARTGVGKTNWLIGAAKVLCQAGKKVLIFSTEMPYAQIWERYIATLDNPNSFREHQFYVCDSFAPNLERVEEAINAIHPDVFMFDHINHVSEEQKELGSFMQGLNFLRRKYGCAGIVTAQLNRQADWVDIKTGEKVTPRMSMIKGSGTIEQASSRVLLLSETRVLPEYTEIVGNLDKNDNGPKGLIHFGLKTNPYRMVEL